MFLRLRVFRLWAVVCRLQMSSTDRVYWTVSRVRLWTEGLCYKQVHQTVTTISDGAIYVLSAGQQRGSDRTDIQAPNGSESMVDSC